MSRSALWRQEGNVKDRELRALQTFHAALDAGRNNFSRGLIPLTGPDDTFNLHPMLLQNVWKSPYFQRCCEKLTDWNTLVDEIYYEVKHMEPWTAGKMLLLGMIAGALSGNGKGILCGSCNSFERTGRPRRRSASSCACSRCAAPRSR